MNEWRDGQCPVNGQRLKEEPTPDQSDEKLWIPGTRVRTELYDPRSD